MSSNTNTWILTRNARKVDFCNITNSEFTLQDIASHLCCTPRFAGATMAPWSVAHHSLLVSKILEQENQSVYVQLAGLMHDAHEAYIGDLPTPFVNAMPPHAREWVGSVKFQLDVAIFNQLHISLPSPKVHDLVKQADVTALLYERRKLLPHHPDWPSQQLENRSGVGFIYYALQKLGYAAAREQFMGRCLYLQHFIDAATPVQVAAE